jgi:TAK1-binding protein 1
VDKLNALNCELSAGTTVVVALVYSGRLYVANVGDSRALLCRTDSNGVLRVVQLSVDHDLRNEDELLRLSQLGLDVEKFKQGGYCFIYFFLQQNRSICLNSIKAISSEI